MALSPIDTTQAPFTRRSLAAAPLRVHLFGRVRVEAGRVAAPVALPNRTLPTLAYLLLHRGERIARNRLAALLWPDDRDSAARNRLRSNLHALVHALPATREWLERDAETVQWSGGAPLWLDVAAFEALARDPGRFDEAAALYVGELAADIDAPWLATERERLRRLLIGGFEEQIERHRRRQAFPQALAAAHRLLTIDPWREDVVRRLIALRYESGDRAGALAESDAFATRLHAELGHEPMPETLALRARIARSEAPADRSRPAGVAAPAEGPSRRALPFIGRQAELAALIARWTRAANGQGGTLLIGGEAGIGKTRLTYELERHVADSGGRVLRGATSAPEAAPYQAFVEALRGSLPMLATGDLPAVWLSALGALLPELRDHRPDAPALHTLDPDRERQRVFEAIARALTSLAAPRPVLLVLEDLHWANEATVAALLFVARRVALSPLLIVGTHRDEETARAHPLRRVRRELQAQGLVEHIAPVPLSVGDVGALLARLPATKGATPPAALLHERSGGNPLFLTHLVASLGDGGLDAVPQPLRAFFATRLARLPAPSRTLAEIAALIGRQFTLDLLQDITGWSEGDVLAALDDLIERRIVREIGLARRFEYGFTHHLVQAAVAESVDAAVARRRHRQIALLLEKEYVGDGEAATQLAFHHACAGDFDAAAQRYFDGALRAGTVGAHDDALEHLAAGLALPCAAPLRIALLRARESLRARRGDRDGQRDDLAELEAIASACDDGDLACDVLHRRVALAAALGAHDEQGRLLAELRRRVMRREPAWEPRLLHAEAQYYERRGLLDRASDLAIRAIAAYEESGAHEQRVQLLCMLARIDSHREQHAEIDAALDKAAQLVDSPEIARLVLEERTCIAVLRDDRERREELCRELIDLCRSVGDRSGEALAVERLGIALLVDDRFAEARTALDEAAAIAESIDDRQRFATIDVNRAHLDMVLGAFGPAAARLERALAMTEARGEPMFSLSAMNNLSAIVTLMGDADRGKALAERALERATELRSVMYQGTSLENLAEAEGARGDYVAAIAAMEASQERRRANRSLVAIATGSTLVATWQVALGDLAGARDRVESVLRAEHEIGIGSPWPQQAYWYAARVLRACGEQQRSRALLDRAYAMMRAKATLCPDDGARATFLAIAWHREIAAAHERGVWPEPQRA